MDAPHRRPRGWADTDAERWYEHVFVQGPRLAQYQAEMQYFGADGLGSVRQLYDASGQVLANSRHDPYGNLMSHNGSATSAFGYTGEQYDAADEPIESVPRTGPAAHYEPPA